MESHTFLAFDLGATSGRAVAGTLKEGKFTLEEIHRFPNSIIEENGKFFWDIERLFNELKQALVKCVELNIRPQSIGIDTWGVDFGYIGHDGKVIGNPRAYRDPYTEGAPKEYFKIIPREELYRRTGIQIMNFNSLYQLFAAKREGCERLAAAHKILFMPDLLGYMLTGNMVCEYTEATTSQMVNPYTKQFDRELLTQAGIDSDILLPITMPGKPVGVLKEDIARETGIGPVPIISVAGHDTASAIAAIPATDKNFVFLSSGTWSLMGIECEEPIINDDTCRLNLTNEGGIDGTTCFLNNITGMWLLEQCRKEWESKGEKLGYSDIVSMAEEAEPFAILIDPNDPLFSNPKSMPDAIAAYCRATGQATPQDKAQTVRCIFESLALCYRETLDSIKEVSPHPIEKMYIIGGGAKNNLMNSFTACATGLPVVAGPAEATAIGNCIIQARAAGLAGNRWEMRSIVGNATECSTFSPTDNARWQQAYEKYKAIKNKFQKR